MGKKCIDYSNKICGCWQVIERDMEPQSKSHETFWKSKCLTCGNIASVRKSTLDKNPRSCNKCKGNIIIETMRLKDDSVWKNGDKYGLLTIIGKGIKKNRHTYVKVQCDCGSEPFEVRLEHLKGQNRNSRTISCGCVSESTGEIKIRQILENMNLDFQTQYRIKNDNNELMIFDFVIFKNGKIIKCIEFNGQQHYEPIEFFGGEEAFEAQKERDARKDEYCNTHGIILQWVPYFDFEFINPEYLNLKNFLVSE